MPAILRPPTWPEDDPAPLMAAADHYDRLGRPPDAAFALQEAAVRLAIRGDIPAARAAFGRAVAIYEALSAILDLRLMQAGYVPTASAADPTPRAAGPPPAGRR